MRHGLEFWPITEYCYILLLACLPVQCSLSSASCLPKKAAALLKGQHQHRTRPSCHSPCLVRRRELVLYHLDDPSSMSLDSKCSTEKKKKTNRLSVMSFYKPSLKDTSFRRRGGNLFAGSGIFTFLCVKLFMRCVLHFSGSKSSMDVLLHPLHVFFCSPHSKLLSPFPLSSSSKF